MVIAKGLVVEVVVVMIHKVVEQEAAILLLG